MVKPEIRKYGKQEYCEIREGRIDWIEVILNWPNGKIFYHLERVKDDIGQAPARKIRRTEKFNGKIERIYEGWQSCFVEYLEVMQKLGEKPEEKDFEFAGAKCLLEPEVAALYKKYFIEFFLKEKEEKNSMLKNC